MILTNKKLIALLMVVVMLFSITACASTRANDPIPTTTAASTTAATTLPPDDGQTPPPNEPEEPKIKNIVLIIGDGTGPEHIAAGQIATGKVYDFTKWHNTNVNTDSVVETGIGGYTTDSAAGATALATGVLTVNGYLGKDHKQKNVNTILDVAKENGKATGIVTTDNLYGATPSGFSAHSANREDADTITRTQVTSGVDYLCGLKNDSFYSSRKNLIESNGYYYSNTPSGLRSAVKTEDKMYLTLDIENSGAQSITLSTATSLALEFLEKDEDGFVLIIEQAHVDKYAHSNDIAGVVKTVESLNRTVETVMEWVGDRDDTAVLVTADHETGGLTVSSKNVFAKSYVYQSGCPTLYYAFSSTGHTDLNVKLFIYGATPDFSSYKYYSAEHQIKNTDVFIIMKQLLLGELE